MKRYEMEGEWSGGEWSYSMVQDDAGDYVLYSDVAPLVEALRKINRVAMKNPSDYGHLALIATTALSTLDADGSGV